VRRNLVIALLAAIVLVAPSLLGPTRLTSAQANCAPDERIDGTTADQAKRRMEGASFSGVHGLTKGCDNVWHGLAMKDGVSVHVAVQPQGQVMQEGD
jgi:hypothetical protein